MEQREQQQQRQRDQHEDWVAGGWQGSSWMPKPEPKANPWRLSLMYVGLVVIAVAALGWGWPVAVSIALVGGCLFVYGLAALG